MSVDKKKRYGRATYTWLTGSSLIAGGYTLSSIYGNGIGEGLGVFGGLTLVLAMTFAIIDN
jgi:hypothetical protein